MFKLLKKGYKYFYDKIAPKPIFSAIVSLLIITAGIIGSVYSDEIKKIIPSFIGENVQLIFWILLFTAGLLFFFRQHSIDIKRNEASKSLFNAIRTVPPGDFMSTFHELYNKTQETKNEILSSEDIKREEYHYLIRNILYAMLTLIDKFDRLHEDTRYGVNIMLFRDNKIIISRKEDISKKIIFVEKECDYGELAGVLELQKEFTVSSDTDAAKADEKVEEIILPIPKYLRTELLDRSQGKKYRVLPGAPFAYSEGEISRFSDTRALLDWCDKNGDFTESVKNEIKDYFFGKHYERIRSFLSIPFPKRNKICAGVINMHSNKKGLLENEEQLNQFSMIVTPFIHDILDVLKKIEK